MKLGVGTAARAATSAVIRSVELESPGTNVYEIDPLRDARWEALVNSHDGASVFHSTNWLKTLNTVYGYDPVVITSCRPEAELTNGLVFCRVKRWLRGPRFISLPFSDYCDPLVNNPGELDGLLFYVRKQVDTGRWKYTEIRPTLGQPGGQTGFSKRAAYRLHHLNLSGSVQELFDSCHKSCIQRKIRRAQREKLGYQQGTSEAVLGEFYNLLVMTRRRQCMPPQPLAWFRALVDAFVGNLTIRVASKGNLPVASILTITHKKCMVYKYGCSDARFHKLGGMPFLFWNAILEAKERGLQQMDMGRSDISNPGLISFKEHLGAVGTELRYWTYPEQSELTEDDWKIKAFRQTVPVMPDLVLKAVGGFLYRHVG